MTLGTLASWTAAAFIIGGAYCAFRLERRQARYLRNPGAAYVDALFVAYRRERRMMAAARSTLDEYAEPYGDASTYRTGERTNG